MITIPRECGEHVSWREVRSTLPRGQAGARAHLSNIDIETGVLALCHGGATQHLPSQGTQETQGRIKVLLQIIIKKH